MSMEILTPMQKVERVSRSVEPSTFVAAPGIWASLQADGSLINTVTSTPSKINKLVIGSASNNMYESNDVEVGRIATLESFGARCKVDSTSFAGVINQGDLLVVSCDSGTEGKLVAFATVTATGVYEHVARCEQIDTTYLYFKTISPSFVTKS